MPLVQVGYRLFRVFQCPSLNLFRQLNLSRRLNRFRYPNWFRLTPFRCLSLAFP
jgi:hypothetical protein